MPAARLEWRGPIYFVIIRAVAEENRNEDATPVSRTGSLDAT
jgi:hypothetical protein